MQIKNFTWTNNHVTWLYNNTKIDIELSNINFSNINEKNQYIYIVCGENFSENEVHFLSYNGNKIFMYNKVEGKLEWKVKGKHMQINFSKIENANLYPNQEVILAIAQLKNKLKLYGFDLSGNKILELDPPKNYQLLYLSEVSKKPSVVCEGTKQEADKHGRKTWNFLVDLKTKELVKSTLAY